MFLGVEAVCFQLKQFVSDCKSHCTRCTVSKAAVECVLVGLVE